MAKMLVVDDNKEIVAMIQDRFQLEGYKTEVAFDKQSTFDKIISFQPDVVVLDVYLEQAETGIDILKHLREQWPKEELPVIVLTGQPDSELCLNALHEGADDFISKPIDFEILMNAIKNVIEKKQEDLETTEVWQMKIEGSSDTIINLTKKIYQTSQAEVDTMILGETGTGKDLAAFVFHKNGERKAKPFIVIDCTTIPEALFESEVFGVARGAYTHAYESRPGRAAKAQGGILFFNEIGELSLDVQAKLLVFLETKKYTPLGSGQEHKLDDVILSATSRDLRKRVEQGKFRKDLYYRLMQNVIKMPPLREHKEDLPQLVKYFLKLFNEQFKKNIISVSSDVFKILQNHSWEGNVRELKMVVLRGVHNCQGRILEREHIKDVFDPEKRERSQNTSDSKYCFESYGTAKDKILYGFHQDYLQYHLKQHQWNIRKTAETIGITREHLSKLLKTHNIQRPK
ncbi:sigma-54-dependent Fis family transcriptional regulator [bacterium]|nr:sigma-54-dependent Fis family transcriptional regulator [bacterium]